MGNSDSLAETAEAEYRLFQERKKKDVSLDSDDELDLEDREYFEESDYGKEEPVVQQQSSDEEEQEVAPVVQEQPVTQEQSSDEESEVAITDRKEPSDEKKEIVPVASEQSSDEEPVPVSVGEWSPKMSALADQPAGTWVMEYESDGLFLLPQKPVVVQHTEPDQIPMIQQELEENKDYPREEFEEADLHLQAEWDSEFVTAVNRIMTPRVTHPGVALGVPDAEALRPRTQKFKNQQIAQQNYFMHDPHFGYYLYYPYPYNDIFGPGKKPSIKRVKPHPKPDDPTPKPDDPTPLPHYVVEQRNVKVQVDLNPRPIQVPVPETRDRQSQTVVLEEPPKQYRNAIVSAEYQTKKKNFKSQYKFRPEPKKPDDEPVVKPEPDKPVVKPEPDKPLVQPEPDKPVVNPEPEPKKPDDRPNVKIKEKDARKKKVDRNHNCPLCGNVCHVVKKPKESDKKCPDDLGTKELAKMYTNEFWNQPKRARFVEEMEQKAKNFVVKNPKNKEFKKMEAKIVARRNLAMNQKQKAEVNRKDTTDVPKETEQAIDVGSITWRNCFDVFTKKADQIYKKGEGAIHGLGHAVQSVAQSSVAGKTLEKSSYSLCRKGNSSMGWFCWCDHCKKSDFKDEVGVGVSLYFKTMKQLIIFFAICSVLSFPQFFCLFKSDAKQRSPQFGADYMLGSLGWSQPLFANTVNNTKGNFTMVLDCKEFDKDLIKFDLTGLLIVQVEKRNFDARRQFENQLALGHKCNYADEIQKRFEADCLRKRNCTLDVNKEIKKCRKADDPRNAIFLKAVCASDGVAFETLGFTASRENITWTIVVFDMIICLCFVVNTFWLDYHIKQDIKEDEGDSVAITDYVLKIAHLPEVKSIDIAKLAFMLEYDIRELIKDHVPDEQNQTKRVPYWPFASKRENKGGKSCWPFSQVQVKVQHKENQVDSEAANSLIADGPSGLRSEEQLLNRKRPVLKPKVLLFRENSQLQEGGSNELNEDSDAQNNPQRDSAGQIERDGSQLVRSQTRDLPNLSQLDLRGQADGEEVTVLQEYEEWQRKQADERLKGVHDLVLDNRNADQDVLQHIGVYESTKTGFGNHSRLADGHEIQPGKYDLHENQLTEIVSIHIVQEDQKQLAQLKQIEELGKRWKRLKAKDLQKRINERNEDDHQNEKGLFDKIYEPIEKRCCLYDFAFCYKKRTMAQLVLDSSKIDEEFEKHVKASEKTNQKIVCAYVTFRSIEGRNRLYKQLHQSRTFFQQITCQKETDQRPTFKFSTKDYQPKADEPEAPDMILWENLKFRALNRTLRKIFVLICAIFILIAGMYINVLQILTQNLVNSAQVGCFDTITLSGWQQAQNLVAAKIAVNTQSREKADGFNDEDYDWYDYQSGNYDLDDIFINDFVNKFLPANKSQPCKDTCEKKYKDQKYINETLLQVLLSDNSCFSCIEDLNPEATKISKTFDVERLKEMGAFEFTKYDTGLNKSESYCIDCNTVIQEIMESQQITEEEAVRKARKDKLDPRCQHYFRNYVWQTNFIYVLPQIIQIFTMMSKYAWRWLTGCLKHRTKSGVDSSLTSQQFLVAYAIQGITIILVSMRINKKNVKVAGLDFPFLRGSYSVLSLDWYRFIGTQIAVTLFTAIFYHHFLQSKEVVWSAAKAWWDRGFKRRTKKENPTKKYIEEDYEDLHIGQPFELSRRYANILQMVGLVFLFSSGIAILYPIACAYFIVGYGVDKFMLVYVSARPLRYDGKQAQRTLTWFKWILAGHFILGVFMYANGRIVTSEQLQDLAGWNWVHEAFGNNSGNDFRRRHIETFFWFAIALPSLYLLLVYHDKITVCLKRCLGKDLTDEERARKDKYKYRDFYSFVNFETLVDELKDVTARESAAEKLIEALQEQEKPKVDQQEQQKEEAKTLTEIEKLKDVKSEMKKKKEAIFKAMRTFTLKAFYKQLKSDLQRELPEGSFGFNVLLKDGEIPTDKKEFKDFMKNLDYIREPKKKKVQPVEFHGIIQTYDMFKHPGYRRLEYYKNKLLNKIELKTKAEKKAAEDEAKAVKAAKEKAKAEKESEEKGGSQDEELKSNYTTERPLVYQALGSGQE